MKLFGRKSRPSPSDRQQVSAWSPTETIVPANTRNFRTQGLGLWHSRLVTNADYYGSGRSWWSRLLRFVLLVLAVLVGLPLAALVTLFVVFLILSAAGKIPASYRQAASSPGAQAAPTPDVPDEAKAEAVDLLGAATYKRQEGELGLALELTRQALGKWPGYADAQSFQATVVPEATAAARVAIAQATAQARAAATAEAQAKVSATQTAVARATEAARPRREQAVYLDPRELVADPKAYIGRNILLQGKALNVEHSDGDRLNPSYTWVNLLAQVRGRSTTESIVVMLRPKDPKILSDECYRFYGVVAGTQRVTRLLTGAVNEVPLVNGYAWESVGRDAFNIGCVSP